MGSAVIFGAKIISELTAHVNIKKYLGVKQFLECADEMFEITPDIAQKITGYASFDDGIAEVELPKFQDLSQKERILILEDVQDPGNLGTILRTAKGLGYEGVHLLGACADPFNVKAISAAKGACFTLPIGIGPIDDLKKRFTFYAADMDGIDISKVTFQRPYAIIFGNEGTGISEDLKNSSTRVAITLENQVESLNVAAAAAIFCYAGARSEI